jgi:hypothetical protein
MAKLAGDGFRREGFRVCLARDLVCKNEEAAACVCVKTRGILEVPSLPWCLPERRTRRPITACGAVQVNAKFAALFGTTVEKMIDKKIGEIGLGDHTEVVWFEPLTGLTTLCLGSSHFSTLVGLCT